MERVLKNTLEVLKDAKGCAALEGDCAGRTKVVVLLVRKKKKGKREANGGG